MEEAVYQKIKQKSTNDVTRAILITSRSVLSLKKMGKKGGWGGGYL